jgi:hypothetical protein
MVNPIPRGSALPWYCARRASFRRLTCPIAGRKWFVYWMQNIRGAGNGLT